MKSTVFYVILFFLLLQISPQCFCAALRAPIPRRVASILATFEEMEGGGTESESITPEARTDKEVAAGPEPEIDILMPSKELLVGDGDDGLIKEVREALEEVTQQKTITKALDKWLHVKELLSDDYSQYSSQYFFLVWSEFVTQCLQYDMAHGMHHKDKIMHTLFDTTFEPPNINEYYRAWLEHISGHKSRYPVFDRGKNKFTAEHSRLRDLLNTYDESILVNTKAQIRQREEEITRWNEFLNRLTDKKARIFYRRDFIFYFVAGPIFSGTRINQTTESILKKFEDPIEELRQREQLTKLYKIHIMPTLGEEHTRETIRRIVEKANADPAFSSLISTLKFSFNYDRAVFIDSQLFPRIVVYPSEGQENAQRLAQELLELLRGIPELRLDTIPEDQQRLAHEYGIHTALPRYNLKFEDKIYYAQGNADEKINPDIRQFFSEENNFAIYKRDFLANSRACKKTESLSPYEEAVCMEKNFHLYPEI
ncbi:hypothetical protein HN446_01280 [bacterium]|jgi:hypothetical protein|nr:hypothetical protein [bacterium]